MFNQEKTGISLIRLNKSIQFRNWMVKNVLVVSLKKEMMQIQTVSCVIKLIMKDYDTFIELLDNLEMEEDLFKDLVKKSIIY